MRQIKPAQLHWAFGSTIIFIVGPFIAVPFLFFQFLYFSGMLCMKYMILSVYVLRVYWRPFCYIRRPFDWQTTVWSSNLRTIRREKLKSGLRLLFTTHEWIFDTKACHDCWEAVAVFCYGSQNWIKFSVWRVSAIYIDGNKLIFVSFYLAPASKNPLPIAVACEL